MQMAKSMLVLSLIAFTLWRNVFAFEPAPLQDFCVADLNNPARVNGMVCKNPAFVQADDFFFSGLHLIRNTSNPYGSRGTPVTVSELPGLNTLGISMIRIDFAPWGSNPPHTHPRATEILTVLEGTLQVGFVTSHPENRLISRVLHTGDVFVFPMGLIHFQRNMGYTNAVAIGALSSQNPGIIFITNAMFAANPSIGNEVLAQAFRVDNETLNQLRSKF